MGKNLPEAENGHEENLRDSSTNTDSDRVLVTKRAVFLALCALVEERDFNTITASDIMKRAGVSRSTFYRCFADKYDVVNWSFKRYKNIRIQDVEQYHEFSTALYAQLLHLKEYRTCYASALRYLGQNSLRDYMFEANDEYMLECWHAEHGPDEVSLEKRVMIRFAAAGCSKVVEQWVLGGCVEEPQSAVDALVATIPPEVLETLF